MQWEMGNQGLDGSELGKVVEPVVTRHFPAGEAAPRCLCLETRAGTLESVYLRVSRPATGCSAGSLAPARQGGASRVSGACGRAHQHRRRLAGSCGGALRASGLEAAWLCSGSLARPLGT